MKKNMLKELDEKNDLLKKQLIKLKTHQKSLSNQIETIQKAKAYRSWQKANQIKKTCFKVIKKPKLLAKSIKLLFTRGPTSVFKAIKNYNLVDSNLNTVHQQYQTWFNKNWPTQKNLLKQKNFQIKFLYKPKISILVPIFNPEKEHLISCIQSVIEQSYDNWELCLADDKSTEAYVKDVLDEFAQIDERIKVVYRKRNGHICRATNSALEISTGKFVALLDNDDILWPNALFEVVKAINDKPNVEFIYTDEDKLMRDGLTHTEAFFKPDWSPDYLRSINYITHFAVLKKSLINEIGGFRIGYEGAQDWELFLRASRSIINNSSSIIHPYIKGNKIIHIPKVLYSWRISDHSTASSEHAASAKNYAYENQKKVLENDLKARNLKGEIKSTEYLGLWNVKYMVKDNPKVSIIIPTKNQYDFFSNCIKSIYKNNTYDNFEVLILDTGSNDTRVLELYKKLLIRNTNLKILNWRKKFNFSAVCNYGASKAKGCYLLFLNNDTEVLSPDWIERMLGLAQLEHIGAVGAKLLYPDRKIQHLGGLLGITGDPNEIGIAGHAFKGQLELFRHFDRLAIKNYSFVTGACLMIKKEKYFKVNGFDEKFQIAFNDVDFCLRLNTKGYFHVVEPYVELLHKESATLKQPGESGRDLRQWKKEITLFIDRWKKIRDKDPFMNPNLSRNSTDLMTL